MSYYIECLQKYAVFSGRARRKEYWYFVLFNVIISFLLGLAEALLGLFPETPEAVLANVYVLATLLPSLGVTVRRLHDTSRSGWWIFLGLVPLIGAIVVLVFLAQDSTPGENQYGPNPKGI